MSTPSSLLDIKLFPDCAHIMKPGSKLAKPISIKDLVTVLSESAQGVLNFSRSERLRLPKSVYLTEYAGNILNLVMYHEQRPATISHLSSGSSKPTKYEIMFPNVVVHLSVKVSNNGGKHEVTNAWYYMTGTDRDNLPSALPGRLPGVFTYLPFNNCYDNFTLCFGRNTLIHSVEGGDLRVFNMFYDVLANSPFNNDLRLLNVPDRYEGNGGWYKKLAEVYKAEQRFPYELVNI